MESDTAFKRFAHEDLFQKHAGVKSNDICPRPEAGPGGSSDESSEQVIKVQCQAAACGATLQVRGRLTRAAKDRYSPALDAPGMSWSSCLFLCAGQGAS